jgi:hypothetical protein
MPLAFEVTKGWKSWAGDLLADAAPRILDAEADHAAVGRRGADDEHAQARLRHRIDRVADEVHQHLLDLDAVDEDPRGGGVEQDLDVDAVLARPDECEGVRFVDQARQILHPPLGRAVRDEVAQAPHDLAGAHRLAGGVVESLANHPQRLGVGRLGQQVPRRLAIIGDAVSGWLSSWASAEASVPISETARHGRARTGGPGAGARPAGARSDPDEARKDPPLPDPGLADRKLDRKGIAVAVAGGRHPADADDLALSGRAIIVEIEIVPLAIGRGHQHRDVLAKHFGFGKAEHLSAAALNDRIEPEASITTIPSGTVARIERRCASPSGAGGAAGCGAASPRGRSWRRV